MFSSTCAVYGTPAKVPITEDTPRQPINPYGVTKLFMENALEAYDRAYGLRFVALRYFNAAGADESGEIGEVHNPETHLIPLALRATEKDSEPLQVFGTDYPTADGTCIRDYIHVNDLAKRTPWRSGDCRKDSRHSRQTSVRDRATQCLKF